VVLTLATDATYLVGSPGSATVTIADNDQPPPLPTVTVVASDASASEGGSNPGRVPFDKLIRNHAMTVKARRPERQSVDVE